MYSDFILPQYLLDMIGWLVLKHSLFDLILTVHYWQLLAGII